MSIIDMAVYYLCNSDDISIKLIATRCLIKYTRKFKTDQLKEYEEKFEKILEPLLGLLNTASLDCIHLPIEAISAYRIDGCRAGPETFWRDSAREGTGTKEATKPQA